MREETRLLDAIAANSRQNKTLRERERQRAKPGDDQGDADVAPRQPASHLTQFGADAIDLRRWQGHAHGAPQVHSFGRERRARLGRADAVELPQFREELPGAQTPGESGKSFKTELWPTGRRPESSSGYLAIER